MELQARQEGSVPASENAAGMTVRSATVIGEDVLYFPVKVAVTRLGGTTGTALRLGVSRATVRRWVSSDVRARPKEGTLIALARESGISLFSLTRYFERLSAYRRT